MIWSTRGLFKKADQDVPDSSGRGMLLQQVSKRLGSTQVLNQINLEVKQGECAVLVGRNGSDKTTLLRMLAGILLPDTGSIQRTMKGSDGYAVDGLPRLPFTSGEYLWDMGRIRGIRPEILRERIRELSELLYLDTAIDQKLPLLSKGTLQKVNLIQALLPDRVVFCCLMNRCQAWIFQLKRPLYPYWGNGRMKGHPSLQLAMNRCLLNVWQTR
ncbi:ATP-binding cassette domain-containing protein [Paenibacillus xylanexedens]|uniref:ATP-binding cassette domain-containing protein n=1 Tax=Paenibacillus xylanexedens TaxID=528191 RepID=UPI003D01D920